jgi:hypothetical protein
MSLGNNTYDQPEKNIVRERIISESIRALTAERETSPVVTVDEFDRTLDYASSFVERSFGIRVRDDVKPFAEHWRELHRSRVQTKSPSDLQVLFLAGPEPVNDLMSFHKHGIPFENIWAIEADRDAFQKGVTAMQQQGIRAKIHRGNLQSFFAIVPQQFDIVYFDATAPLFGGSPNTIHVIKELFLNQRLCPLAVLATNFAEVGKDESSLDTWANRLGCWGYAHGSMETFTQEFPEFVETQIKPNFQQYYGEFVTKFLIQFASQLVPWWRVAALPGSKREYFNEAKILTEAADKADDMQMLTNVLYPLLRLVLFSDRYLEKDDTMSRLFFKEALEKVKLADAVKIASLIRTFYEIKFDGVVGSTRHVLDACSPQLAQVLEQFTWFDQHDKIFCDTPLPNLITDLLLGLYGFPYHANIQKVNRYAYKAKQTVMFTDVMVFDQARYVYDLIPTLPLFDLDFGLPQQLVLRSCVDALHRHCHYGCKDLFWGGALASAGEAGFSFWLPEARECIGNPGVSFSEPTADGDEVWSGF